MLNIQGLDPSASSTSQWKIPYLEGIVKESVESYSIISITETWLKPPINDAQLSIQGYNIHRSDRTKRERGGCCLYILESLTVSKELKFDNDFCEVICCIINKIKTIVFSVYRPDTTPG